MCKKSIARVLDHLTFHANATSWLWKAYQNIIRISQRKFKQLMSQNIVWYFFPRHTEGKQYSMSVLTKWEMKLIV